MNTKGCVVLMTVCDIFQNIFMIYLCQFLCKFGSQVSFYLLVRGEIKVRAMAFRERHPAIIHLPLAIC